MVAPTRFSTAVREAVEAELPGLRPANVRVRFHLKESATAAEVATTLATLARRGSQGVLLKAPDEPSIAHAVHALDRAGIPTVTLVTDVTGSDRVAYVGADNVSAGRTAAYVLVQGLSGVPGAVLATVSRSTMSGEQERLTAFVELLHRLDPAREVILLSDSDGLDAGTRAQVRDLLSTRRDVSGVYSISGGNAGLLAEFAAAAVRPVIYLAHDLDADNLPLLISGQLSAVLHHDLRADLRSAVQQVLRHHRLIAGAPTSIRSVPQVVTPHNIPHRLVPDEPATVGRRGA